MSKKIAPDTRPLSQNPFAGLHGIVKPSPTALASDVALADSAPLPAAAPSSTSASPPAFRTSAKLVVRMERKGHGGKTVTRVSGVHPGDAEQLARELKKALGTGVRVDVDGALTVQGDLVERVIAILVARGATQVVRGSA